MLLGRRPPTGAETSPGRGLQFWHKRPARAKRTRALISGQLRWQRAPRARQIGIALTVTNALVAGQAPLHRLR